MYAWYGMYVCMRGCFAYISYLYLSNLQDAYNQQQIYYYKLNK